MPKKMFLLFLIGSLFTGLNVGLSNPTFTEVVSDDEGADEDPEAGGPPFTEDNSGVYTDSVEYSDPYLCPATSEPCASARALSRRGFPGAAEPARRVDAGLYHVDQRHGQ